MKDMFIACWKVSSKITMSYKTLQCLFEDYSIWSLLLILILNLRNCMVERDESTADHSDIHEVPKVPHESSWMKHKSQIHHLK